MPSWDGGELGLKKEFSCLYRTNSKDSEVHVGEDCRECKGQAEHLPCWNAKANNSCSGGPESECLGTSPEAWAGENVRMNA